MAASRDSRDTEPEEGSLATTVRRDGPAGDTARSAPALPSTSDLAASDTLAQDLAGASGSAPAGASLEAQGFAERYAFRAVIGRGGMGEVRLCADRLIGREIAVKVLHRPDGAPPRAESSTGAEPRFLREARVQGQLEHPAIVPVYDLGRDERGEAYFTMKRVRGSTLEEIVAGLRSGDAEVARQYSRRKLLTAFTQVCLAIDFAHSRGVVHRDLKPGNVMLGDFGEVYVLDWGIARVTAAPDAPDAAAGGLAADLEVARTQDGETLGTPGYMAPEQVRGEADLDARADVYALGCVLFELLALEPLHRRTSLPALLGSTLKGADARPSARAPDLDVPPELDAICVRATALGREERHASARSLCTELERYLDGDRDLERRRQLADEHAGRAAACAAEALASGELEPRREAMREAGRALALDPQNASAATSVVRLLLEPPERVPEEAAVAREHLRNDAVRIAARRGLLGYVGLFLGYPLFLWMGIRATSLAVFATVCLLSAVGCAVAMWRYPTRHLPTVIGAYVFGTVAILCGAIFAGPLVLVPAVVLAHTAAYALRPGRLYRVWLVVTGLAAMVVPALAEWSGLIPTSYTWTAAGILISPTITDLPELPTRIALLLLPALGLLNTVLYLGHLRDALDTTQLALHVQAWQLRQLVPEEARGDARLAPVDPPLLA